MPLRVSFLHSGISNWGTCNVGLDSPDMTLKNQDVLALLGDIFGCYYWMPEVRSSGSTGAIILLFPSSFSLAPTHFCIFWIASYFSDKTLIYSHSLLNIVNIFYLFYFEVWESSRT